jgi:hypothetical protein
LKNFLDDVNQLKIHGGGKRKEKKKIKEKLQVTQEGWDPEKGNRETRDKKIITNNGNN